MILYIQYNCLRNRQWWWWSYVQARGWTASWLIVLGVIAYLLYDNYQNWRLGRKGESIGAHPKPTSQINFISYSGTCWIVDLEYQHVMTQRFSFLFKLPSSSGNEL